MERSEVITINDKDAVRQGFIDGYAFHRLGELTYFVRKLRDTNKLSQEEIGNIIGVTRTYITNVESTKHAAKYNLSHINLLADYFHLSPRDFLPEKSL